MNVPLLAGAVSTAIFALSTLPMVIKAGRTKDLGSYSLGNIVLANIGNVVHSVYVLDLPYGPIWWLHAFYVVTTALMLFWYVRYVLRRRPDVHTSTHAAGLPDMGLAPDAMAVTAS